MSDKQPWYESKIALLVLRVVIPTVLSAGGAFLAFFAVPAIKQILTLEQWTLLSLLLLIVLLVLLLTLAYLIWSKNREIRELKEIKLEEKFGVYWSKNKKPHCIKCKGVLSVFEPLNNGDYHPEAKTRSFCNVCGIYNRLNDNGNSVSYDDIIDRV